MIKHLFKLIWNQKRKNMGLLFEFFFSFLVLFAVLTFIIYNFSRYREPLGFDIENMWQVNISWNEVPKEDQLVYQKIFKEQLKNYPQIEHFSFSNHNTPYGHTVHINGLKYENNEVAVHLFQVDEEFQKVYRVETTAGRWFEAPDMVNTKKVAVINRKLSEQLFGEDNPIGKNLEYGEEPVSVVGLVDHYKYQGEFSTTENQMFISTAPDYVFGKILLRLRPGTGASFESKLIKELSQLAKGTILEVSYLDNMRKDVLLEIWLPMIIFIVISGFLILNVAMGLFGVLWQNINIRKAEIGVRRAMGATQGDISWQFIGEVMVLATLAMAIGAFFAIQFPLLDVFGLPPMIYLLAIGAATLVIYSLVVICAFFPSRQAAQLHPAMALHEE
ncbi:MAG: ABC transporter permease [Saprospiraceae bacterium]